MQSKKNETVELVKIAIVGALYVAVSLAVAPLGYGAVQFRISEMFNHLALFNKRYVWSMIVGCIIVNLFSPLGLIDMAFGVAGTVLNMVGIRMIVWYMRKHDKNWSLPVQLVLSSISSAVTMLPVAIELVIVSHVPFWITYATTAGGELISCLLGAIVIYAVSTRVDLTK